MATTLVFQRELRVPRTYPKSVERKQEDFERESERITKRKEGLRNLWANFSKYSTSGKINYEGFYNVRRAEPEWVDYLSPAAFLAFPQDSSGNIDVKLFFSLYIKARIWMEECCAILKSYDLDGDGCLNKNEIRDYVKDLRHEIKDVAYGPEKDPNYEITVYVHTLTQRLLFFLDRRGKGKIRIRDFLAAPDVLKQLDVAYSRGLRLNKRKRLKNIFYWQSVEHILNTFKSLNVGKNNRLTPEELLAYKEGLTHTFIKRVFEEIPGRGTMDLKEFLNFSFAMENKSTPQGLSYFFRIFDVEKKGYLTRFDLHFFLKEILRDINDETIAPEDEGEVFDVNMVPVLEQIFARIKPEDPRRITKEEILKSGMREFVGILISTTAFDDWANSDHHWSNLKNEWPVSSTEEEENEEEKEEEEEEEEEEDEEEDEEDEGIDEEDDEEDEDEDEEEDEGNSNE